MFTRMHFQDPKTLTAIVIARTDSAEPKASQPTFLNGNPGFRNALPSCQQKLGFPLERGAAWSFALALLLPSHAILSFGAFALPRASTKERHFAQVAAASKVI